MPRRLLSVYGHEFKMLTVLDPGWCAASSAYIGVAFSLVGRRVSAHADQLSTGWRSVVALTVELKTAWSIITCVRICCHRPDMSSTKRVLFAVGIAARCVVYRNCRSCLCVWCSGCRASAHHVVKAFCTTRSHLYTLQRGCVPVICSFVSRARAVWQYSSCCACLTLSSLVHCQEIHCNICTATVLRFVTHLR